MRHSHRAKCARRPREGRAEVVSRPRVRSAPNAYVRGLRTPLPCAERVFVVVLNRLDVFFEHAPNARLIELDLERAARTVNHSADRTVAVLPVVDPSAGALRLSIEARLESLRVSTHPRADGSVCHR